MRRLLSILLAAGAAAALFASSNIDPDFAQVEAALIGEIDWRPDAEFGAMINQYYCSGFLKGAQVGWIKLGSGTPRDGVRYRNDSPQDFGVNVLPSGALRGFAYGANIGWISFDERGGARVDWTTGTLSGSAYAANAGWISLESGTGVRVDRVAESPDLDNDGLPDAWEIAYAGTLTVLHGNRDSDGDGASDREEFLAGTNPLDKAEKLGPVTLEVTSNVQSLTWPSKAGYLYLVERRASLQPGSPWIAVNIQPVIGTGNLIEYNLPALAGSGFYRVRAYPPLTRLY